MKNFDELIGVFYTDWTESDKYWDESAVENEVYKSHKGEVERIIGKEILHEISDELSGIGCDAEYAGFGKGFRYGVDLMCELFQTDSSGKRGVAHA